MAAYALGTTPQSSDAGPIVDDAATSPMNPTRCHPLLAWLCLTWFGLLGPLFAGGVVVCRDAEGGSRLEWGCTQNSIGECASVCLESPAGHDSEHVPAMPCDDIPIRGDHQFTTTSAHRTLHAHPVVQPGIASVFATVPAVSVPVRAFPGCAALCSPLRPPDSLARLRAVVLLV